MGSKPSTPAKPADQFHLLPPEAQDILKQGVLAYAPGGVVSPKSSISRVWARACTGSASDVCRIGTYFSSGRHVRQSHDAALTLYRAAALLNDGRACYHLGVAYYEGKGVEPSIERAVHWWHNGIALGCPRAMLRLGQCYDWGIGVGVNEEEAARLYQLSADKGHVAAYGYLGMKAAEGTVMAKDVKKALSLWNDGAKKCDPWCFYCLGVAYETGLGVEKQEWGAFSNYVKAAHSDNAQGWLKLAECYTRGIGVQTSEADAMMCYEGGALLGDTLCMYELARCYLDGVAGCPDSVKAQKWLMKAAALGHGPSAEALELLMPSTASTRGTDASAADGAPQSIGDASEFTGATVSSVSIASTRVSSPSHSHKGCEEKAKDKAPHKAPSLSFDDIDEEDEEEAQPLEWQLHRKDRCRVESAAPANLEYIQKLRAIVAQPECIPFPPPFASS